MQLFLLTSLLIMLLMLVMSIGVIFSNRELKGSCGGQSLCICEATGRKIPEQCKELKEAAARLKLQKES